MQLSEDDTPKKSYITYTLSGGRLGDNLIAYMHAKWFCYLYHLPMLYKPFKFSDKFIFHEAETLYTEDIKENCDRVIYIKNESSMIPNSNESILYIIHFFPECVTEAKRFTTLPFFTVNWEDVHFRQQLKSLIRLNKPFKKLRLPKNKLNVAVHLRRGGGHDPKWYFEGLPLKFPPFSFYIDQIRRLQNMFPKKALNVHLFTDDRNPMHLRKKFEKAFPDQNIVFHCRKKGNAPDVNILEDFFALTQFDCLIRPESNFSIAAEKISDHQVIIYPARFKKADNKIVIDQVHIHIRDKKLDWIEPN